MILGRVAFHIPLVTATKSEIEIFLVDVKKAIDHGHCHFNVSESRKTTKTLRNLGIMVEDALDIIHRLCVDDIFSGPEKHDRNPDLDKVWMFKIKDFYQTIYIKLQILYQSDKSLYVMSFHIDGM